MERWLEGNVPRFDQHWRHTSASLGMRNVERGLRRIS